MSEPEEANVVVWHPPPGFDNPVPPARGERHIYEQLSEQSPKAERGGQARGLKATGIVIALFWIFSGPLIGAAGDKWDSIKQRAQDEIDKVTHKADTSSAPPTDRADGRSNLPGGYAGATYVPLDGMTESVSRRDTDAPFDGSYWLLNEPGHGWATLSHLVFVPPVRGRKAQNDVLAAQKVNEEKHAGGNPVSLRESRLAGHDAWEFRYQTPSGEHRRVFWVFGPVHSYALSCDYRDASMEDVCASLQRTLQIKR
jgi:hypothetical protein